MIDITKMSWMEQDRILKHGTEEEKKAVREQMIDVSHLTWQEQDELLKHGTEKEKKAVMDHWHREQEAKFASRSKEEQERIRREKFTLHAEDIEWIEEPQKSRFAKD